MSDITIRLNAPNSLAGARLPIAIFKGSTSKGRKGKERKRKGEKEGKEI